MKIFDSEDIGVRESPTGAALYIKHRSSGGASSPKIKAVQLLGLFGDFIWCLDPADGATYYAAVPWLLRESTFTDQSVEGTTIVRTAGQERRVSASIGGLPVTEIQRITPSYSGTNGEMLLIEKVGNAALGGMRTDPRFVPDDAAIEWTDRNESARAWAAVAVISGT